MTLESEFCTVLVNSLNKQGLGYKIPDPNANYKTTSKRPFDIMGILLVGGMYLPCYIEAKFSKVKEAFNFKRVETHQSDYLKSFGQIDCAKTYVILGVRAGRRDTRAYIFDWKSVGFLYPNFSIHAKYLDDLPYNEIHHDLITFDKVIDIKDLERVGAYVGGSQ